ncbi:MFS transporter [Saccharopolyspora erythraea]|uniref:MFS transporter n=1 Tax=Saccharopolyspora erythraea TaxID=1836 RepID=UPI001BA44F3A|nr:MFS transporter [Saccharopolyspora erythraea]QUH03918.1 MFS transporter [Saccharopolyspora erythraea]
MSSPAEPDARLVASGAAKFFRRILPMLVLMLVINQMDRTNVGFIKEHVQLDIGVGAAAFGLGAGLFFVGYALFEVPSNMILERVGARMWLTRIMISWGVVTVASAFVQNEVQFALARFLLGVCEAGFFPGVIYYFTKWLPDTYRGRANAIFLGGSATAYIVTGPVSGALLEMHGVGDIAGWRWMFFFEGVVSVVVGALAIFVLRSRVEDAPWLTPEEKSALSAAVRRDAEARRSAGTASRWRLLLDVRIVLLTIVFFAIGLTTAAITFWLPSLVGQIEGTSDFAVGLLSAIPWLFAVAAMYLLAKRTDGAPDRRPYLAGALVLSAAGAFLATVGGPWFGLVALVAAAVGVKCASTMFWPLVPQTLDVRVAAGGIALINSLGNLAGFFAPSLLGYIEESTGSTDIALYVFAAASLVALAALPGLRRMRKTSPVGAVAEHVGR